MVVYKKIRNMHEQSRRGLRYWSMRIINVQIMFLADWKNLSIDVGNENIISIFKFYYYWIITKHVKYERKSLTYLTHIHQTISHLIFIQIYIRSQIWIKMKYVSYYFLLPVFSRMEPHTSFGATDKDLYIDCPD